MTRLFPKDFLSYGAWAARGKALLAILLLAGPTAAEDVTVLAMGDSLTQGYGLPEAQGLVPRLENWLKEHGHEVRVVNGGVSGDTTAGGAARAEWSLTPEVDAMIVTLGGNDLLRGIDPEVTKANLARILDAAEAQDVKVLLVGMQAPGNYGPDYKDAFDSLYPDLAEQYGTLYFEDFFKGLGERDLGLGERDPGSARQYFQSDGIHPNAEGVASIVDAIGPAVVELVEAAQ